MRKPEYIEATLFLLALFISFFLGTGFSMQVMNCKHSEKRGLRIVSSAFLIVSIALVTA